MNFADELKASDQSTNGVGVFWEMLKPEIKALGAIGHYRLRLCVVRDKVEFTGKGIIPIIRNMITLPEDPRQLCEELKPFAKKDGLTVDYVAKDAEGDGEGVLIRWK